MRSGILLFALLALAGCSSYNSVNQGWEGPTSPAESGQHGATADQIASSPSEKPSPEAQQMMAADEQYTNGNYDPTMEMSGNIAAQGNYAKAQQQRQSR